MNEPVIVGVDRSRGEDETCYCLMQRIDTGVRVLQTFDNAEDAYLFIWKNYPGCNINLT